MRTVIRVCPVCVVFLMESKRSAPLPVRISWFVWLWAGYTVESHGLSVVIVVPVISQPLMCKARYRGSRVKSMHERRGRIDRQVTTCL